MLLGTLGASLLGNLLTGKGIARAGTGSPLSSVSQKKKGKGTVRAGTGNNGMFNTTSWFNKFCAGFSKKFQFYKRKIPPLKLKYILTEIYNFVAEKFWKFREVRIINSYFQEKEFLEGKKAKWKTF